MAITAPPVDGQANSHLIKYLAKQCKVAKGQVRILRGELGRHKTVAIDAPKQIPAEIAALLDNQGGYERDDIMKTAWMSCLLALLMTLPLRAEQMQELGPWKVHYSAFNSSFLTPEVARTYGLERSRYNGIVNIAVQNKQGVAQAVGISGEARNLTGTLRTLNFQEVKEGNAIYYLAVLPYRNEDTYQFTLKIMGEGQQQTLSFQQTFYVD